MVMILVNLDRSKGLTERMDVEVGDWEYTQLVDYVNVPLWCVRCHGVGHVIENCNNNFVNNVW